MSEKIKLYLPTPIKSTLMHDAELFEFIKRDGSINLNAFLKCVIVNYFSEYERKQADLYNSIESIVGAASIPRKMAQELSSEIQHMVTEKRDSNDNNDVVTLTVSGDSARIIEIISRKYLIHAGLSEYLRRLLLSYLSVPRNMRERIVFRERFNDLSEAIGKQRLVSFKTSTQSKDNAYLVVPYCICSSKQEQFNYLICFDVKANSVRSFRITRLRSIYVEQETGHLGNEELELLKTTAKLGPQFSFQNAQEVCVYLTEEGKRRFRLIYTNRPEIEYIEENCYHFFWPVVQIEEYFKRFGKEAVILTPETARNHMISFYADAIAAYTNWDDKIKT